MKFIRKHLWFFTVQTVQQFLRNCGNKKISIHTYIHYIHMGVHVQKLFNGFGATFDNNTIK